MKTLFKILLTLAILTACFNAARYYLNNFQFEDAAQQRLLFETRASEAEIVNIMMRLAAEYQIPLQEENVSVRMVGMDRVVEMEYTEKVPLLPGVYSHEWKFTPRTSTRMLNAKPGG